MNDLRNGRPVASYGGVGPAPASAPVGQSGKSKKKRKLGFMPFWNEFLLISVTIVLAATITVLILGSDRKVEKDYIDPERYQAVFIGTEDPQNLSRTYFGKLKVVDNNTYVLSDVYVALQQNTGEGENAQSVAVLDKIGCGPIQGPIETLYVNRESVAFWINLRSDSKLSRNIQKYKETYPKPIECDENGVNKNAPAQAQTQTPAPSTDEDAGN